MGAGVETADMLVQEFPKWRRATPWLDPGGSVRDGRRGRRAHRAPRLPLSFAGLLTTMALASLDQNIVSTALPRIVAELGELADLPWVITAFMLTAKYHASFYGKFQRHAWYV